MLCYLEIHHLLAAAAAAAPCCVLSRQVASAAVRVQGMTQTPQWEEKLDQCDGAAYDLSTTTTTMVA